MTELTLNPQPSTCNCGAEHASDYPRIDARQIPHAIRHGAILGALDQVRPGQGMVLVAPHDPVPLLRQIEGRFDDVTVTYLQRGPEEWHLLLARS